MSEDPSRTHIRFVARCYALRLEIAAGISTALDRYLRAADNGNPECAESFPQMVTAEQAIELIHVDSSLLYLCQILLSPFEIASKVATGKDSASKVKTRMTLLCHEPEVVQLPLQRAL